MPINRILLKKDKTCSEKEFFIEKQPKNKG
jgi:hypothetical protein